MEWHPYDPEPCQTPSPKRRAEPRGSPRIISTCINTNSILDSHDILLGPMADRDRPRITSPVREYFHCAYVFDHPYDPPSLINVCGTGPFANDAVERDIYTDEKVAPANHNPATNTLLDSKEGLLPTYMPHSRTKDMSRNAHLRGRRVALTSIMVLLTGLALFLQMFGMDGMELRSMNGLRPSKDNSFSKVSKRCNALEGISYSSYVDRLQSLRSTLDLLKEQDGKRHIWISEPSASSAYYTAISQSQWHLSERPFLFVLDSASSKSKNGTDLTILTPEFESDRARILPIFGIKPESATRVHDLHPETALASGPIVTLGFNDWPEEMSPFSVLVDQFQLTNSKDIHVDQPSQGEIRIHLDPNVRSFISSGIATEFKRRGYHGVKIDVAAKEVLALRERKSQEELALLECANQITLQAIRETRNQIRIGMNENQVSQILEKEFAKLGMNDGEGLVLFGENAALPHGSGTNRKLGKNDFVLIDAGGTFKGYVSDITRTFAVKGTKLSETQLRIWELVAKAQKEALVAAVAANATGATIDAAARDIIRAEGHRNSERKGFTHRLGHGIGLEGHESPYLVGSNHEPIQVGNTFSDEPGVYIVGELGVRLEDCWVLEKGKDGERIARLFTEFAKSPWEL